MQNRNQLPHFVDIFSPNVAQPTKKKRFNHFHCEQVEEDHPSFYINPRKEYSGFV
jgi:hypothetical protein